MRARRSFPGILASLRPAAAVARPAELRRRDGAGRRGRRTRHPDTPRPPPSPPRPSPAVPTWRLTSYRKIGFDRSFKADLIDELPEPPRLVVFGGSRAMRFEPPYFLGQAGLPTFNCSVQNCRPTDAYAFASYLFSRAPDVKLGLPLRRPDGDVPPMRQLHAGLLYDERLAAAFPGAPDRSSRRRSPADRGSRRSSARTGSPIAASSLAAPTTSARNARLLLQPPPGQLHQATAAASTPGRGPARRATRSRPTSRRRCGSSTPTACVPAVVVMPYHPRALRAFREVGLPEARSTSSCGLPSRRAQTRCDFRVRQPPRQSGRSGAEPRWFYDGAHVTRENARRIIKRGRRSGAAELRVGAAAPGPWPRPDRAAALRIYLPPMTPGTTSRRGSSARQIGDRPAHRRPAAVALAAGLSALAMLVAVAAIATAGDLGGAPAGTASAASPSCSRDSDSRVAAQELPAYRVRQDLQGRPRRRDAAGAARARGVRRLARDALRALVTHGADRPLRLQLRCAVLPPRGRLGVQLVPVRALARHPPALRDRPAGAHVHRRSDARRGLLYDPRLASAFPDDARRPRRRPTLGEPRSERNCSGENRYTGAGATWSATATTSRASAPATPSSGRLDLSTARLLPNHSLARDRWPATRARRLYFEKTVQPLQPPRRHPARSILMPVPAARH